MPTFPYPPAKDPEKFPNPSIEDPDAIEPLDDPETGELPEDEPDEDDDGNLPENEPLKVQ
ncbi:MAG: hypothetical protein ABSD67_15945 [Terracidiphilus sp.]|jgi:hypothetical protein